MDRYVDGYVLPVPRDRVDEYRGMAAEAGQIWMKHGALQYVEGLGDDLDPDMGDATVRPFPDLVDAGPDETVVFAFVVYASRDHRDEVNERVTAEMDDPDVHGTDMPFDVERMAYGGFTAMVDL